MGMMVLWLFSMLIVKFFFDISGMIVYTIITDLVLFIFGIAGLIFTGRFNAFPDMAPVYIWDRTSNFWWH